MPHVITWESGLGDCSAEGTPPCYRRVPMAALSVSYAS
jgi:hypothetical protein